MDFYHIARELRRELKEWVRDQVSVMVKLLPYSTNTADGTGDKVQGYQTEGSDEQPYDFDGRRIFPFGIRSRPPVGTLGVWIGVAGESGNGVIVGAESSRFGPSDLNDGEVAFYNKVNGCLVKLDQNGGVTITDAGGSQVKLDGSGNVTVQAAGTVTVKGSGAPGSVQLGGTVKGNVLIQTLAVDSWGVPVTQVTPTETQAG
jgi:phage gp45-like